MDIMPTGLRLDLSRRSFLATAGTLSVAIAFGATTVRIGSALFGDRGAHG